MAQMGADAGRFGANLAMSAVLAFLKKQWLVAALPLVVLTAWQWPEFGVKGGALHTEVSTKAVVAGIFVLLGLGLPTAQMKAGVKRWPLHLLVQTWIFLIFPLLGIGAMAVLPAELGRGFLYLCVLPTTISMSVVLTAQAGGNTAVALFNSVVSNFIGVVLTPLWVSVMLGAQGGARSLGAMVGELSLLLLLPFALGQAARRFLAKWADGKKGLLGAVQTVGVLFLVYAAFCELGGVPLAATMVYLPLAAVVLLITTGLTFLTGRLGGFAREDLLALVFCGSQKTLAVGVPMAGLIFGPTAELGVLLLPLMFYHPLQLLLGVWLASRGRCAG